jgi:hypothetical protein
LKGETEANDALRVRIQLTDPSGGDDVLSSPRIDHLRQCGCHAPQELLTRQSHLDIAQ